MTIETTTSMEQSLAHGDDRPVVLEVKNLDKSFSGVHAVSNTSFTIHKGEVVAIIGPNGSGKSTTINMISGLFNPDSGQIVFEGKHLEHMKQREISDAGIARTFQNGRVFGSMTVDDNLEMGLHKTMAAGRPLRGLQDYPLVKWANLIGELGLNLVPGPKTRAEMQSVKEQVDAQAKSFGDHLADVRGRMTYSLSYANKRRTEIGRAMISEPHLLCLDEPTAGMNQTETAEVMELLLKLKAEGNTMLLVEHKMDFVMTLSDWIIVMDNGRIISEGIPSVVRNDPRVINAYLGGDKSDQTLEGGEVARVEEPEDSSAHKMPISADAPYILDIQHADVFYGSVQALRDVSLNVREGQIVSLLGGNAVGKSTTMRTIMGLLNPKDGKIIYQGKDLQGVSTENRVRRGIASVPEARRIFPEMTVTENLLSGAYIRKRGKAVDEDMVDIFDRFPRLKERRNQMAGTLSGGEQQMLAFGRALMSKPKLICMDEPTMGLSPKLVDEVLGAISSLRDELRISVLLIEQQADLALTIADYGFVLLNGEIVLEGSAKKLSSDSGVQEAYLGKAR
ncbi:ABC transporter [Bifidobacterium lemurum]|uniref:ABC transporter n=1 Tax=Bifidobacterium lemurum TaxID=1603886 RepID=A0A261FS37_9BIFI|nr:ATP-binding cassette domain-containing protein [Bifidobacterium lemurum]OZG61795.1 ABC transporter [Bifidobacterium lemurum]QOL34946.1 ATP-binding cassette domain-containing protein [Bifidobacterium lemurum]